MWGYQSCISRRTSISSETISATALWKGMPSWSELAAAMNGLKTTWAATTTPFNWFWSPTWRAMRGPWIRWFRRYLRVKWSGQTSAPNGTWSLHYRAHNNHHWMRSSRPIETWRNLSSPSHQWATMYRISPVNKTVHSLLSKFHHSTRHMASTWNLMQKCPKF